MRGLVLAALFLSLAVPAATAQVGGPTLDMQVQAPTEAVGPDGVKVTLTLRLLCPSPTAVLPDQVVGIEFRGPAGSVYDGPESVFFPSRMCAQQNIDEEVAEYVVKLPRDVNGSMDLQYQAVAEPYAGSYNPLMPPPNHAEVEFVLRSPAATTLTVVQQAAAEACAEPLAEQAEDAGLDKGVANVPGLGWLAPLAGMAVAVLARRRLA